LRNKDFSLQKRALAHLKANIPAFKNVERQITSNSDAFDKWLNSNDSTTKVPQIWENKTDNNDEISKAVYSYV